MPVPTLFSAETATAAWPVHRILDRLNRDVTTSHLDSESRVEATELFGQASSHVFNEYLRLTAFGGFLRRSTYSRKDT